MNKESRVKKSILNAKVNVIFYFIYLLLSFFSRKAYLECLGDNFVGLTSTLNNLLGFLNLAELGIGSAIGYVLYKPLYEQNHSQINEIISVFGYLYRWIGYIILICGIVLSLFLPFIFGKASIEFGIIYFAFYSYLFSSLIGYFVNYKQTLLGADQRNYVITAYFQSIYVIKTIIQISLAYCTRNYFIWVSIEFCFGIIYAIVLNWKIKKVYPWLNSDISLGRGLLKKYPEIIKFTKQLFVHKIATFAQLQTTPLILYIFTNLKIVAYYTNYTLIANQLLNFANKFLSSTEAGIGNMIAERNREKIFHVFQELTSIRFYVASLEVFGLYMLIESFISIWLGEEYILKRSTLILIIINIFIMQVRGTNDQFLNGYGLFRDVWAPIVETVVSLCSAVILGHIYGLNGVLCGMLVGMFPIVLLWKPYFLFHYGMKLPISKYWLIIGRNILAFILSFGGVSCLSKFILEKEVDNYLIWTIGAVKLMLVYIIVSYGLFYLLTPGIRYITHRFIHKKSK